MLLKKGGIAMQVFDSKIRGTIFFFKKANSGEIKEIAERLKQKDLQLHISPYSNRDEAVNLLKEAIIHLGGEIDNILYYSNSAVSEATRLDAEISKIKLSAQKQTAQTERIATASEEMSQTIVGISKNATTASEKAGQAVTVAEEGKKAMDDTVKRVSSVADATLELKTAISNLDARINEIGEVVEFIKDVADQTNLLALNAAIEAARAGEHGRGFAVVADEVRKLAERTMKATKDIEETLSRIKDESGRTTSTMKASIQEVEAAKGQIEGLKTTFDNIVQSVEKTSDEIAMIATAVEEQSAASEDITRSVEDIVALAKSIDKDTDVMIQTVDTVVAKTTKVSDLLGEFRFNKGLTTLLERVKADHRMWVKRLYRMYHGLESITQVGDHKSCRLGRWYYSEMSKNLSGLDAFKSLEEPHKRLHIKAQECVDRYNRGEIEASLEGIMEVENISHKVVRLIEELKEKANLN